MKGLKETFPWKVEEITPEKENGMSERQQYYTAFTKCMWCFHYTGPYFQLYIMNDQNKG